jgi:lipoprotein-anchoring transpeptidase ErfK/SrfK
VKNLLRVHYLALVLVFGISLSNSPAQVVQPTPPQHFTPIIKNNEYGEFLPVLPDTTDQVLARKQRTPRNITTGFYIIIMKKLHKLGLYQDGILIKVYPIAIGRKQADKAKDGDDATPEGFFNLKSVSNSTDWIYYNYKLKKHLPNLYGPWFYSVNTGREGTFSGQGWRGIGIHGTNNPASIGGNMSAGCIRLYNEDIVALKAILDSEKDVMAINVDILP